MKIKLVVNHGLGDVISFQCVLNNLKKYKPENQYFVETYPDYQQFVPNEDQALPKIEYDMVQNMTYLPGIFYHECKHLPATKATRCLFKDFGVIPTDTSLYTYKLDPKIGEFHGMEAKWLVGNIDKYICLQGAGHTMRREKNLNITELEMFCSKLSPEIKVVLIDFAGEFDLSHVRNVVTTKEIPFSAGNLIYLMANCSRYVGIDSGPKAVALALGKPCTVVWKLMHPYHNVEHFNHLTNWVSKQVASRLWANPGDDLSILDKMYNCVEFDEFSEISFPEMQGSVSCGRGNPRAISDKLRYAVRKL